MSTKATRATLQIVTDRLEDSLAEEGLSRAQRESYEHQLSLAREALSEVEAIERAAKCVGHVEMRTWRALGRAAFADTMESVAKDAP